MQNARDLPGTGSPASAHIRHMAPMALWWTWFTSYFFPDPIAALEDFGTQTVAMRTALMAGFAVAAALFALSETQAPHARVLTRNASHKRDAGPDMPRDNAAASQMRAFTAHEDQWGPLLVACCLSMSVASLACTFASLGQIGPLLFYALLMLGGTGCGYAFLRCYARITERDLLAMGRCLGLAALFGGTGRIALVALENANPLAVQAILAALPWVIGTCLSCRAAQPASQANPSSHPHVRITPMFCAYAVVFGGLYGFMLALAAGNVGGKGGTARLIDALSLAGFLCSGVALLLAYRKKRPDYVRLLRIGLLLITLGLLALAFTGGARAALTAFFVAFGYVFYWLLFNVAWAEMAERNDVDPSAISPWGLGLSALGICTGGLLFGALRGPWVADAATVGLVCLGLCVVLLLMSMFMVDSRVFVDLGGMVKPAPASTQADLLIARVDALSVRFGLTAREREIALMLARGRNPRGIAEKLDISVNTVRTHIHHIYDKCQVHSDQELIDLVEVAGTPSKQ